MQVPRMPGLLPTLARIQSCVCEDSRDQPLRIGFASYTVSSRPMKIALIAPPFIAVPPKKYGGTELFIAELAEGLQKTGVNVVVYANGESTVNVECRWTYEQSQLPSPGQ